MLKKSVIFALILATLIIGTVLLLIIMGKCCFTDTCEIPINSYQSLPLFVNLKNREFLYPQNEDAFVLQSGESITLGCPGSKLNVGVVHTEVTCISETTFQVLGSNSDIAWLFCEEEIKSTARYTGRTCENNNKEIEVGFDFGDEGFVRQMRVCFDDKNQNTLYSEHNLTNQIKNQQSSKRNPFFQEGSFYNLSGKQLYELYNRPNQRSTVNKQLGLASNSTQVIGNGASFFLSRGHLAPRGDFFYATQKNASYYYVNSAPQWEIINSKTWNYLEWKTRDFALRRSGNLQIFTGTYDTLTINSSNPLFLYFDEKNSFKGIPIPKHFWKVVYDAVNRLAVAFVGTNNPYMKSTEVNPYCSDISKSLKWIKFLNKNITRGYIYACDVNDLRKRISFIPQLDVNGLLVE